MSPRRRSTSTVTVRQAADLWWRDRYERGELKPATATSYRGALRYFADSAGRDRLVQTLTREDVERFQRQHTAARISTTTLRWRLVVIRLWSVWLYEEGYCDVNICRQLKLPRKRRSVPRGVPALEVGRALAYATDTRERLLMSLMVREGLRSIEVSRLDLDDIDSDEMSLFISQGKGDHQRLIPLTRETLDLVDAYVDEERGKGPGRLIQSRHQSVWNDGDGVKSHTIFVAVGRAMKRAGAAESAHGLRHTYAHNMIDAGASIRDVQVALGHASLATTQVYLPKADIERLRQFAGRTEFHLDMVDDKQRGKTG